jgi:hypothetical protein
MRMTENLFGRNARWGTYRNCDFCLMLAKIAYSYAVADVGLEALSKYELPLPKLILERSETTD